MPHGQPDFGMYAAKTTVGSMSDMGELAARLGSIVTLDRRGDVIFLEDFEAPILNWDTGGSGAGEIKRLYPDEAFMGSQSLYMATGATAEDYAYFQRRFPYTLNQRYGIEAKMHQITSRSYFDLKLSFYTGKTLYEAAWRYDSEDGELLIKIGALTWKSIATSILAAHTINEWWSAKLVIDSQTKKYTRGLFLGVEYDLSAESIYSGGSGVAPCIEARFDLETRRNVVASALFDNIILTQNEP